MAWLKSVMDGHKPKDLYAVLGCAPSSTHEQIKTEYKMLVLGCHPDRHPNDPVARARFHELSEAFSILGDPSERQLYDEWKASGLLVPYAVWRKVRHLTRDSSTHTFGKEKAEKHPTQHWRPDDSTPALHPVSPSPAPTASSTKSLIDQFRDYDI